MMNRVPVVSNLSPLLSDMTGTCLRRVDVIVLMAFQRAVTSPLSSVTSSLFLFFFFFFFFFFSVLTPTCYPSIAPSASQLCFQFHFDFSPLLLLLRISFFFFFFPPIYRNYLIF